MAKPRIFVSSTYYDLRHIRKSIELFISEMGYEAVLFENGDIPFDHREPLDESCYKELDSCHIMVLVIGGRYGSGASDETMELSDENLDKHYQHFNSITRKEYETAIDKDIPAYIFIESGVAAEYQTFRENRDNDSIKYAHVDSVNIFRLIDSIYKQRRNNLVKEFDNVDEITNWLRDQWAGLFTSFLTQRSNEAQLSSLEQQLSKLNVVTESLKDYSENIIRGLSPDTSESIIQQIGEKEKLRSAHNVFVHHTLVEHLVEVHDCNVSRLYDAFIGSNSASEFLDSAVLALPEGERCGMLYDSDLIQVEFGGLREELGLEPWGDVTKKSSRRPKGRS
jgi:hypothetical protein